MLFRRGERAARAAVAGFDTGAWSLYSQAGRESTLNYHQLVGSFLGNLCRRTRGRHLLLGPAPLRPLRARAAADPPRPPAAPARERGTALRFSLSKLASVRVRVTGARGVTVTRDMDVPRGTYTVPWTPARRGRYRVRIAAQGPSGPLGVRAETVRVRMSERAVLRRAAERGARKRGPSGEAARRQASRPGIAPLRKASTKRRWSSRASSP